MTAVNRPKLVTAVSWLAILAGVYTMIIVPVGYVTVTSAGYQEAAKKQRELWATYHRFTNYNGLGQIGLIVEELLGLGPVVCGAFMLKRAN